MLQPPMATSPASAAAAAAEAGRQMDQKSNKRQLKQADRWIKRATPTRLWFIDALRRGPPVRSGLARQLRPTQLLRHAASSPLLEVPCRQHQAELANGEAATLAVAAEEENKAVVRELYEAISSRDAARVHQLLAPDLEWWFHGPPRHQHLRRLLTGEAADDDAAADFFQLGPVEVAAFGSTIIAEGFTSAVVWVHAWTVGPAGVITQVREYLDTSLTVTRLGGLRPVLQLGDSSQLDAPGSSTAHSCLPVWQSRLHRCGRKSLPGLVLAI